MLIMLLMASVRWIPGECDGGWVELECMNGGYGDFRCRCAAGVHVG